MLEAGSLAAKIDGEASFPILFVLPLNEKLKAPTFDADSTDDDFV